MPCWSFRLMEIPEGLSGMSTGNSISRAAKSGSRKMLALSHSAEIAIALLNEGWDHFQDSDCTEATSSTPTKVTTAHCD